MNSTSDKTLIPKLDVIFARHGIPHTFKSDNGPPFNGNEFKTYLTKLGVTHETSTPECPQGNSVAEAFMKPLGKAIRTARAENRNCMGPRAVQVLIFHLKLSNHTTWRGVFQFWGPISS
jgi:transposase InsO family protein